MRGAKNIGRVSSMGVDHWRGTGSLVLAACLPTETSFENDAWQNGAFTKAILASMEDPQSDVDGDGQLSFTELELATRNRVRRLTDGRQNPTAYKPMTVSEVMIAATPKGPSVAHLDLSNPSGN